MTIINSVLGPIDSANMGYTLLHEHILSAPIGICQDSPELLGEGFMDRIIRGLIEVKEAGINTIIDASTFDLGRDISVLAEASLRSGVNVITCTGWWLSNPHDYFGGWSIDQFADLFIREINEGIDRTGTKAGILKSAADRAGVTKEGEITLRAVARAHLQTCVPIMLHSCSPQQVGRRQIEILKEEGADLKRVKIDHSLDTTDTQYLIWIMEQGCWLGADRLPGLEISEKDQLKTIKELIDAGWAHRLLFSHDAGLVVYAPEMPPEIRAFIERGTPYNKYLYIKNILFPELQKMGVSSAVLDRLCIDNPRRFFEGT